MKRVTKERLEAIVKRINNYTNSPETSYTRQPDGKLKSNPGNYHLNGAYGGWKLSRNSLDGHGQTDVLSCGYVSKRELESLLFAFIRGLDFQEENKP